MLHLVFCENGLDRIKEILRPSDQVVQLSSQRILLVDTEKYLSNLGNAKAGDDIEGEVINQNQLARIISNAQAIKSTY